MTELTPTRLRHENARRRTLVVAEKRQLTPNYLSIRFACDDFGDFTSASFDDHIKLFLTGESSGGGSSAGGKPPMRDYTPRAFDPATHSFVIDFALHENPGPATAWAIAAQVGDVAEIGGPRGSVVIPASYDWYWLIGDEAAIPAIGRKLDEASGTATWAIIAVDGAAEQVPLPAGPAHELQWIHRSARDAANPASLLAAIAARPLPAGEGFVWIAAEAGVAKALREAMIAKGQPLQQIKAAGYWTKGLADTTARFE